MDLRHAPKDQGYCPVSADAFAAEPVVVRAMPEQATAPLTSEPARTVPINSASHTIELDTPLFVGRAQVMVARLPSSPASVFAGRRRQLWIGLQGRFKAPVSMESLQFGSTFERALRLPPAAAAVAGWLVGKLGGGASLQAAGSSPHVLAPLCAAAQVINVSRPGCEPASLLLEPEQEDMTLLDPALASGWKGKPMSASKRRAFFGAAANRAGRVFTPEHVWTINVWEHLVDYSTFSVSVPIPLVPAVDLCAVLDGQPMQLMARDAASGQLAFGFELWHRAMLGHAANGARQAECGAPRLAAECKRACSAESLESWGSDDTAVSCHAP